MDPKLVRQAIDASRHRSLAGLVERAPGVQHPCWTEDEVAHLNALLPEGATKIDERGLRFSEKSFTVPSSTRAPNPFFVTRDDAPASTRSGRKIPLVRVMET